MKYMQPCGQVYLRQATITDCRFLVHGVSKPEAEQALFVLAALIRLRCGVTGPKRGWLQVLRCLHHRDLCGIKGKGMADSVTDILRRACLQ